MSVETFMKPMSHDWGPATSRWRPIWKHEFMHTICREITNAIWTFTSLDVCFSFLVPAFPTIVQWCPTLNVILLLLRMCDRCLARQGKGAPLAMHYKNFSDNKAWPLTILSHEGYLHFDQFSLTPWLVVPGFKMETMTWDLLHNIYLGTARDLVGSGLKTLVMRGCYDYFGEGLDMDTILSHVDGKIRRDCSRYKFPAFKFRNKNI